jgi:hypothetical protein
VTDQETEIVPIVVEGCAEAGSPVERPRRWKRTFFVNDCPLFKAMRVAYVCEPDPAAPVSVPAVESPPLTGNQDG